jgi:hypothetical protein
MVWMMSDSAHAAWDAQGAFTNDGDRIVAEFAIGSPFLEVSEILDPTAGAGNAGGND